MKTHSSVLGTLNKWLLPILTQSTFIYGFPHYFFMKTCTALTLFQALCIWWKIVTQTKIPNLLLYVLPHTPLGLSPLCVVLELFYNSELQKTDSKAHDFCPQECIGAESDGTQLTIAGLPVCKFISAFPAIRTCVFFEFSFVLAVVPSGINEFKKIFATCSFSV